MEIKIVISCWPSFKKSATEGLRQSLQIFSGSSRILEVLDTQDELKISAYGFRRDGVQFNIFPSSHCYLSVSKNRAANEFSGCTLKHQHINCDGILFMDADHTFKPQHIMSLIRNTGGIIGAAYTYRSNSNVFVAGQFDKRGIIQEYIPATTTGRVKVGWVGGGFVYIPGKILELLEYPWFRRGVIDCGDTADELGEDIGLCLQAREHGISVYCDCDCRVGHGK